MAHFIKSGSDHTPLLISLKRGNEKANKPFRFLNFLIKEESFKDVIRKNCKTKFEGNSFMVFYHMMKKIKKALIEWSREIFRNVFQEIATWKDTTKLLETNF